MNTSKNRASGSYIVKLDEGAVGSESLHKWVTAFSIARGIAIGG